MKKFFKDAKGHLMTGIGYMLPLIIGASLVVAIPKLIGVAMGINSLDAYADSSGMLHVLYLLEQVGWTGIGLVNTVLAGFIAYSIADKPAIGAGLIGGALATNTKAGFLGAVVAAFIAGYVVKWAKEHINLPEPMQQMMPLVITPFLATGAVAIIMGVVLATPLALINDALVSWLRDLCNNGTSQLLLSIVLGAMIACDMGGPINKSAWMAGNVLMTEGIYQPNVYINCAICIPPLAYAISTVIKKKSFSPSFKEAGKGNWVMGFIGITEGAIPFTLVKASRLVPVNMIGGALGAAITCLLGANATIPPVGGMYGFVSVGNGWAYLIGIIVGALFIAIVAPMVANFNDEQDTEIELTEDEIEIDIQI